MGVNKTPGGKVVGGTGIGLHLLVVFFLKNVVLSLGLRLTLTLTYP